MADESSAGRRAPARRDAGGPIVKPGRRQTRFASRLWVGAILAAGGGVAWVLGIGTLSGCFDLPALTGFVDTRTADDIDGDGIANALDDDMDGDGVPNDLDPDADADGRFDRPMIIDFPFDHNAFIKPLLPPGHPDIDFNGRVVMPNGHIDVTSIIHVNFAEHPMEVFEPKRQEEIAAQGPPEAPPGG